ncbi:MmgE/PrpD family protein [Saccharopolyspora sp. NPDC050389]|uniref:MmgE/PrpD family protein n=1 Tax=Saccharopolyspora sp. NPDC050389 TaxID=3155516 RepID=UPI003403EFE5
MPEPTANLLGEFIAGTTFAGLPGSVADKAKRHLLDTLGAALAGARTPETTRITATLTAPTTTGAAIWGTGLLASPRDAALANGVAAHALELDDTGGCDHSGAVVVPAALAALSLTDRVVSGAELLVAIVVGYDLARRALEGCGGYQEHNQAGWHSTGTCGPFGSAAAAARILALAPEQCSAAVGFAASMSGGLWAFVHNGALSKRLHAGRAAEAGVTAAALAGSGTSGPVHALDDVWGGFLNTFAPETAQHSALTDGLGEQWRIQRCAIKPHASCRGTHSAIDAVAQLMRDHDLHADEIREVRVRLSPFLADMCSGRDTRTLGTAQLSLPYAVSAQIAYGTADLSAYSPQRRSDERVRAIMDCVSLDVDASMPASAEPIIDLITEDGSHPCQVTDPLGSPANPIGDDALIAKFRSLAAVPEPTIGRLVDTVMRLDELPDARQLLEHLV